MLAVRLALFCGLLALCAGLYAQQPVAPVIREVVFVGADVLPQAARQELGEAVQPLVGQRYDEGVLTVVREAILETGWVSAARVRSEPVDGNVRLIVEVEPNPAVQRIDFIGNTALSDETLQGVIATRVGEIFSPDRARADAEAIQEAYANRGYTLARVADVTFTREGVLQITVLEPTITEIRIEGNRRTRESVVRQLLVVRPGQPYNVNDVRQSLAALQRLGIFADVSVTPTAGAEPGAVILTFQVEERRTGYVNLGGSYNDVSGFSAFLVAGDANLAGTAQRLDLLVQTGGIEAYQLNYFNPLFGGPRTGLGATFLHRQTVRQVFAGESSFDYTARRTSGTLTVVRQTGVATQFTSTLRIARLRALEEDNPSVPPIILGASDVRSLAFAATRDTRTSLLNPDRGSFVQASTELAGLLGGDDFIKLNGEARRYWALGRRAQQEKETVTVTSRRPPVVFAGRVLGGTAISDPPFLDQYFLGGPDTLRGYELDRFVGTNILLLNGELRVPLTDSLQGALFVDAGDAWGGDIADALGQGGFDFEYNYGIGARVLSPIGPIRLDYGINRDGESQFYFSIGPAF